MPNIDEENDMTQKEKHDQESGKDQETHEKLKREHKNEEIRQQMQQNMRSKLENLPRFNYKSVRFYRYPEEMQKAIDMLSSNNIKEVVSKTLTDNYLEEIFEKYIILPGEYGRILKTGIIGGIIGGLAGIFHGTGLISLPMLNPVSAGGAVVSTVLLFFLTMIFSAAFRAILLLFKPIPNILPGYSMLTVYGNYEDKKLIEKILNESVTVSI